MNHKKASISWPFLCANTKWEVIVAVASFPIQRLGCESGNLSRFVKIPFILALIVSLSSGLAQTVIPRRTHTFDLSDSALIPRIPTHLLADREWGFFMGFNLIQDAMPTKAMAAIQP